MFEDQSVRITQAVARALEVPGLIRHQELGTMAMMAAGMRGAILDLGTFCGRSAVLFDEISGDDCSVYTVDDNSMQTVDYLPDMTPTKILAARDMALKGRHRVTWHEDLESVEKLAHVNDHDRFALCFIDASKTYSVVSAHIRWCWKRLAPGGILLGHDFQPPFYQVMEAVDNTGMPFIKVEGATLWMLRKTG